MSWDSFSRFPWASHTRARSDYHQHGPPRRNGRLTSQLLRIPHCFLGLLQIAPDLLQPRQHGIGYSLLVNIPPLLAKINAMVNILICIFQLIALIGQSGSTRHKSYQPMAIFAHPGELPFAGIWCISCPPDGVVPAPSKYQPDWSWR